MKTAITIHIAERVFTIDEDAHSKLDQYLTQLRSYFAKDATEEESKEIISDIENRIAEILEERLGENRPAVNMEDISHVMKEMGTVEDIAKEEESAGTETAAASEAGQKEEDNNWRPGKKLYRDPDNKVLGGVCAGLAAYFDVDVTFFRIAALLLLLLNGVGILVYLILWIAMPEAETASEKAAMRGKRANISNIEKNVKARLQEGLTEEDRAKARTGLQKFYGMLGQLFQGLGRAAIIVLKIVAVIVGISLLIAGVLTILIATYVFVSLLIGTPAATFFGGTAGLNDEALGGVGKGLLISGYATVLFLGSFVTVIAASMIRTRASKVWGWAATVFFVLFCIAAIVAVNFGLRDWSQIEQSYNSYTETVTSTQVFEDLDTIRTIDVGGNVELNAVYGEEQRVELIADEKVIDQYEVVVENGELRLKKSDWNDFCFFWCYTRPTQLNVQLPVLEGIEVSGSSEAYVTKGFPRVEEFTIDTSGASYAEVGMNAESMRIEASGSSHVEVVGEGKAFAADISGASLLSGTYVAEMMDIELSGSSDCTVDGSVADLKVRASGASGVSSELLEAQTADLRLTGSSDVILQVATSLYVDASGASSVRYYGTPTVQMNTSGASSVTPLSGQPGPDDTGAESADVEDDAEQEDNESTEVVEGETVEEMDTEDTEVDEEGSENDGEENTL